MSRPPLPDAVVERIRRERYAPRPTQPDYLHLEGLRRALVGAFAGLPDAERPEAERPALDLYCGTQPYRELIPRRTVVGVDRHRYFARADVVADLPLPFADGAFSLVLCTEALQFVDDPAAVVRETWRVLAPGGYAVLTVPYLLAREVRTERRPNAVALRAIFAGWDVAVDGIDDPAVALAYAPGLLANKAARRVPALRVTFPLVGLALTAIGMAARLPLRQLGRRWPASWLVVARRPAG